MEVKLPNFKGEEKNTLYFIGNGFDLFHGLKTKFVHFYSWLNLKDKVHESFAYDMESFFPYSGIHGNFLWVDFEHALGKMDVDFVHQQFAGKEENSFFDENYQKRAAKKVHSVTKNISNYLKEWLTDTERSMNVEKVLPLSKDSLYLTFNYTTLLEKVYGISSSNVIHIHNCINSKESLITGHCQYFPERDDPNYINNERSLNYIVQEANNLRKPVESIIKSKQKFFKSLKNINNIVVFGHSLSIIDRPYFTQVLNNVSDNARWFFVCIDDLAKYNLGNLIEAQYKKLKGYDQYKTKLKPENCEYIIINY